MWHIIVPFTIKKSVKPVTCCSLHCVRLSHCLSVETSNAKPHADSIYATLHYTSHHDQYNKGVRKTTHEAFTVALFLTDVKNLRDSTQSKPKRQVNAFSFVSSPPFHPIPNNWIWVSA